VILNQGAKQIENHGDRHQLSFKLIAAQIGLSTQYLAN